jgi:hypothetical protein
MATWGDRETLLRAQSRCGSDAVTFRQEAGVPLRLAVDELIDAGVTDPCGARSSANRDPLGGHY